ncbi:MAG: phosphoribosylamine--glycine ligase [Acidobacteria bacterium]|nr:phosphoribosylamine--glycine ligase [Acidobacteriota bacterium]
MRVLVVGNGGREHALTWKLRQSPLVDEIFVAPGNAGIAEIADCVPIGVADVVDLLDFAEKLKIDLTVVGPELPLTLGIVDEFHKRDLRIFGPTKLAAEIEGSKVFSKEFMVKYGIPTAASHVYSSVDETMDGIGKKFPLVMKVDGLAGGKGVAIVNDKKEAEAYAKVVFDERKFGNAGSRLVVEEFLEGEELSFMVLTDGKKLVPLSPAKDYKKALDGDEGPNTGGMGAHSPAIILPGELAAEIMKTVMIPTVQAMAEEGRPYTGCLYAGIMLTPAGPKVLEFNCRFGDPETQVQMMRLESDLAEVMVKVADGNLGDTKLSWKKEAAAGVVVAMSGYPGPAPNGVPVTVPNLEDPSIEYFHSATGKDDDGNFINVAGRVITACGRGATMSEALTKAYKAAAAVKFDGAVYRKDIGYRAMEMRKKAAGE